MNKRRLGIIEKWLRAGTPKKKGVTGFNMKDWSEQNECGTTCCIAGAAVAFFEDPSKPTRQWESSTIAQELLGLGGSDAFDLFYASGCRMNLQNITPLHAARAIRKFIDTGTVDWVSTQYAQRSAA